MDFELGAPISVDCKNAQNALEVDYEQKYKEAMERAKQFSENPLLEDSGTIVEYIFPELKESEDERIRKDLIAIFKGEIPYTSEEDAKRYIVWLEKQGEQKPNPYSGTSFEYNGHIFGMCARDNGVEILFDGELKAFLSSEKSFIYPIHPQPYLASKSAIEAIKEEKVNNQNYVKPANKVEPKFHKGDWITNGDYTWKIVEVKPWDYILQSQNGNIVDDTISHVDEQFHSFTIEDAKDGDVLVDKYGNIGIYQGDKNAVTWNSCCYCGVNKRFYDEGTHEFPCYPATKEQRDTLMKAITDAGYEWDAEKKELKKIEQKSPWSDEDDVAINRIVACLENLNVADNDILLKDVDWLKSFKDRVQPKQEWSEEDEAHINSIIDYLLDYKLLVYEEDMNVANGVQKELDWLESLKQRIGG